MPTYRYVAYTEQGETRRGRLEALDIKQAREQLIAQKLFPREVKGVSESGGRWRFTASHRAVFYRELSSMLAAGLPLEQALEILSEREDSRQGMLVADVRDRIREGAGLSEALSARVPEARGREEAVLSAGELSGRLDRVTAELADTLEEETALAEEVRSALTYPLVLCGLAVVVLAVMVGILLPMYEGLLSDSGQELPTLTTTVLALGRGARHPLGLMTLALLVAGSVVGVRHLRQRPLGLLPLRRFQLPVIGALFADLARTRFARTLALLLEGGVALPEAVQTAGKASGSPILALRCRELSDRISHGERLAEVLQEVDVLREELPGWIRAGESSGDLAPLLRHAARASQRSWKRGMRRSMALLEPLLILLVGGMILLVALSVLLPMLELNKGLGG
jgi:general secretion pathway protein F